MRTILLAVSAMLLGAFAAMAADFKRFEIIDHFGFEEPVWAFRFDAPADWQVGGQVLWNKPCSPADLYETPLTARSADGLTGFRLMPGHFLVWFDRDTAIAADLRQMFHAQMEAERNKLRTRYRGSNCHVALIEDGESLFRRIVLSNRPAGAAVVSREQNTGQYEALAAVFASGMPQTRIRYDAMTYRLEYPLGGVPVIEDMQFRWYSLRSEYQDAQSRGLDVFTTVEQLRFEWVRKDREAADRALLKQIGQSFTVNPIWAEKVAQVRAEREDMRRKQHEQDAMERQQDFSLHQQRQQVTNMLSDLRQQEFLALIRGE